MWKDYEIYLKIKRKQKKKLRGQNKYIKILKIKKNLNGI